LSIFAWSAKRVTVENADVENAGSKSKFK